VLELTTNTFLKSISIVLSGVDYGNERCSWDIGHSLFSIVIDLSGMREWKKTEKA
jgi:hypothetical protein